MHKLFSRPWGFCKLYANIKENLLLLYSHCQWGTCALLILAWYKKNPYSPQRHNTKYLIQIFPEKELCGLSPNFHIYASVSDLYVPMIGLSILLQENMWTNPWNIKNHSQTHECGNGTEATQFFSREYTNGIFVAVFNIRHCFPKISI